MFVILLRFSDNKSKAPELMEAHNAWLGRGFDEGAFLVAGSLKPGLGGAIIATASSIDSITERVNADPFVIENVVSAEVLEVGVAKTDPRVDFLKA